MYRVLRALKQEFGGKISEFFFCETRFILILARSVCGSRGDFWRWNFFSEESETPALDTCATSEIGDPSQAHRRTASRS